ncbi:MAG: hypothetical protein WCL18_06005 [bacterium]
MGFSSQKIDYSKALSSKAIIDLFLVEQQDFFLKNWLTICKYLPEFQPLCKYVIHVDIKSLSVHYNHLTADIVLPMDESVVNDLLENGGE